MIYNLISLNIPEYWYLIAEVFHVFNSQILLQENFNCNFCTIPNATEDLSKESFQKKDNQQ